MIRLNTSLIKLVTSVPLVLFLSMGLIGGPYLTAQDQSVLELTPREPQAAFQNNQPEQSLLEQPNEGIIRTGFQPADAAAPVQDETLPAPDGVDEGTDVLMQAPLHEAFAEVPLTNPVPNGVIFRKPPALIEEVPPEFKPEGENVVWISGYWYWDDAREDFLWVSGVWRDTPAGQKWISGYWNEEPADAAGQIGYRWVNGFWTSQEMTTLNYLPQPPAPLEVGPSMPAPSEDYFYVPGCWIYQQTNYVWRPGYYTAYVPDMVWIPPTYIWTPGGYIFRPGYWDYPIEARGVVFAPIYFRQPVYLQPRYFFRPRVVINTGLGLLPHLFVRRHRHCYYFGNWYGNQYSQLGYYSWSSFRNNGFYRGHYDPLFNYYGSPFARYQGLPISTWAFQQHRAFAGNPNFRPPVFYNQNLMNQWQRQMRDGGSRGFANISQDSLLLADTLERRVSSASQRDAQRAQEKFVRLNEQQQKRELQFAEREIEKQRRDWEREVAKTRRNNAGNSRAVDVPLTSAAKMDPERQARLEKQALARQETQARIQQKQAEANARAQARRAESDQARLQNQLNNRANTEAKQQQRDSRGQPDRRSQGLSTGADVERGSDSATNRQAIRQSQTQDRRLVSQLEQQQREQRNQQQAAQRQAVQNQRQAEATQRQAEQVQRRQATSQSRQVEENARLQQRQLEAQQRQMEQQRRQMEQQQRRQIDQQPRQRSDAAQRQLQENAQRQAEAAARRQNNQLQQSQDAARRQMEQQQRQMQNAAQRQAQNAQREAQNAQRQMQQNAQREARNAQRQAQDFSRRQGNDFQRSGGNSQREAQRGGGQQRNQSGNSGRGNRR